MHCLQANGFHETIARVEEFIDRCEKVADGFKSFNADDAANLAFLKAQHEVRTVLYLYTLDCTVDAFEPFSIL